MLIVRAPTSPYDTCMKKQQKGFAHHAVLLVVIVVAAVGLVGWRVVSKNRSGDRTSNSGSSGNKKGGVDLGNLSSTDPVTKGKSLANGQCTGEGSTSLTHAPMDAKDLEVIEPYGLMVGGHVTPVDHQYYWGLGENSSPADKYPVYATADGVITGVELDSSSGLPKWFVILSHSCTFFSWYNLMTSLAPDIKSQLPAGWGPNSNGGVKISVKSGQVIGYVGGQSLDFAVWDTTKNLTKLLYPVAYNVSESWKVNTALPLDYFSEAVRSQVLPKYIRTAEPRDGELAYDVSGQAVGTWFMDGTNGYAGNGQPGMSGYWKGHLSLAYDFIDTSAMEVSVGDYQGQPTQFAVKGGTDWKKITPDSGVVKVELAQLNRVTGSGSTWTGSYAAGIKVQPGPTQATALLQMTGKDALKFEVFPGKTPAQVSGFDSNAKTYNRGQDAHIIPSTTAK